MAKDSGSRVKYLLRVQGLGAKIVCTTSRYRGSEVEYRPRFVDDAVPWVLKGGPGTPRFTSRECQPRPKEKREEGQ
jgi:hypothetical protein